MTELDLSHLPTEIIRSALCETVESQLESKNYRICIESASLVGENNFLGEVYRVSFSKTGQENVMHKLILKVAPQNPLRREKCFSRSSFTREIYMYDWVLPALRQFEKSKGVKENGFIEYPKCYRTVDVDVSECLLLEDMSIRGFRMIDRHIEETTLDHVGLVMQALGKLHAISFAMKDQQPQRFEELASSLKEILIIPKHREYLLKQSRRAVNILSGKEDAHLLERVKKLFEKEPLDIAADCIDPKITGSTVISHGDAWQNNLMFQYDSQGRPVEISLLDWQMSRCSSPIVDILYYIFGCSTKKIRDVHYGEFLKLYHDTLSAHIRRLGSDPDKLFPYNLMMEHLRKFGKIGLILATVIIPVFTKEMTDGMNLDEITNRNKDNSISDLLISDKSRGRFEARMREVIVDMVRLGYI